MEVRVQNLIKKYGAKTILEIPEIHFAQGSITGLLGDNGTGKTTLLNIISGLDRQYEGQVFFNGKGRTVQFQRETVMIRCRPYLFKRSVYENIEYPLKVRRMSRPLRAARVNTLIREFRIEGIRNQKAHTLSGGEVQKVALARALAAAPSLLLLDETTTNIHSNAVQDIERLMRSFHERTGCTIIFVTHDHTQAERFCNSIITLKKKDPLVLPQRIQNPPAEKFSSLGGSSTDGFGQLPAIQRQSGKGGNA